MKRILLLLACLMCTFNAFAKDSTANASAGSADTQQLILDELKSIRSVQDSTYNQRMRAVKARTDAASRKTDTAPSEYSILTGIEDNTDSNFFADSWNLYGIFALIFSIWALYYAWRQYKSQKETEIHTGNAEKQTKNAPISVQKGKLAALPRHFYRNLACTGAMIFNHLHPSNGKSAARNSYPSESNLLKLQTLPDDIFLPIDIDERSYKEMHELKLLFRNYNMEILVASEHLSKRHLTDKSLEQDFDNLLFKPLFLTRRIFNYEKVLCETDVKTLSELAAYSIVNEHFTKLRTAGNISVLLRPENNGFLKLLLEDNFSYLGELDKKGALARSINFFSKEDITVIKENCSSELSDFIMGISDDKETFKKWFEDNYGGQIVDAQATLTVDELHESMKPYLTFVSEGKWSFKTLLYYMLAVDIAIETDRIGMINHKSE